LNSYPFEGGYLIPLGTDEPVHDYVEQKGGYTEENDRQHGGH